MPIYDSGYADDVIGMFGRLEIAKFIEKFNFIKRQLELEELLLTSLGDAVI